MAISDLTSINAMLKDHYPLPGERIKQYVVDMRRESKWERDTCPAFDVAEHEDNTGASCRNVPRAPWHDLEQHDCCYVCNDQADSLREGPSVQAWLAEKARRPPIETDKSKLSDEVQR